MPPLSVLLWCEHAGKFPEINYTSLVFWLPLCGSAGVQGIGDGASFLNIPGWVAAVIKQAVLLLGCLALHFALCPGSARGHVPLAHSRIFGSGGLAALAHHPPFPLPRNHQTSHHHTHHTNAFFGVQTSVVLRAVVQFCLPESPSPKSQGAASSIGTNPPNHENCGCLWQHKG